MRILLIGDTHGNFAHLERRARKAKVRFDVDVAFQLGDFGFVWDKRSAEKLFNLNEILAQIDLPLYWLDGNHENFELMEEEYGIDRLAPEFKQMFSHITYSGRGNTWEWDGVKFMSYGGAVSVDKGRRVPYLSWWPHEEIIPEHVSALPNTKIDVLLSHDSPDIPDKLQTHLKMFGWGLSAKLEYESRQNSRQINRIIEKTRPHHVYHGHMHYDYKDVMEFPHGRVEVRGLNESSTGNAAIWIVDTEDLK